MWWNDKYTDWFDIYIENPLKTWKKAKKYFKKPKISIHFFTHPMYNCPTASFSNIAKILVILSFDVGWKDKFDSPRHERNPYIWVCFFKRFGFSVNWDIYYEDEFGELDDGSVYYWEYLLDYVYYNKSLKKYPVWTYSSKLYRIVEKYGNEEKDDKYKSVNAVVPIVAMSLNKEGIKELKQLING